MNALWRLAYDALALPLLWCAVHVLSLFSQKVRRAIQGRRQLFDDLAVKIRRLPPGPRIWFHSSSMGEFEQAKPIIAALKRRDKRVAIVVSFFSPSGYEHSLSYPLADLITYIPFDTRRNARRFLDLLRPDVAIMVRYDVWPNHVWELRRRGIPTLIANATLRATSLRLRGPVKHFHSYLYNELTAILTVSEADAEAFRRFATTRPDIRVIGETRYDQVIERSEKAKGARLLPTRITRRKKIIVAGSSWPEDEEALLPAVRRLTQRDQNILLVLVPHEPTLQTLDRIENSLQALKLRSIRFSHLQGYSDEPVILVDGIGILMALYRYAHVAYVGGSFKQGVHNVLEPAVYGIPVLYGPKHTNSQEAVELARLGGGFVVSNHVDVYRTASRLLHRPDARRKAGNICLALVRDNTGATDRILDYLAGFLPQRHRTA
jgi:3-deoxy-D-manno-octulosonic-acid transferase